PSRALKYTRRRPSGSTSTTGSAACDTAHDAFAPSQTCPSFFHAVTSDLDLVAGLLEDGRSLRHVHALRLGAGHDDRPGPDECFRRDRDGVADRRVDAEETVLADMDAAGDHDVRADETMVVDHGV